MKTRRIVLSGCSSGGKTTLLQELARRGFAVFKEPGRAVLRSGEGDPLLEPEVFARACIRRAMADHNAAGPGLSFYDRSLVDAVAAMDRTGQSVPDLIEEHRYDPVVFLVPPWRAIYVQDAERQHGFDDAVAEYEDLLRAYPAAGYRVEVLAKTTVAARADLVLTALA